ncbi:transferrin-binding protein-like solute binding protein [Yoonia sp. F2084L]|uniref:transferrin-binding protein-like solute binding protein n=1 Tax=Yoonia sp. F2084L TaxID=2926419 RepID=UPI001FF3814A|nr:transferrin-binding protein-like solute binding protein [Yoonia sp. F2084L]MCK0095953.1 transferrin-binding protein-like solute binding protein [Yoonia sp. F2084L]
MTTLKLRHLPIAFVVLTLAACGAGSGTGDSVNNIPTEPTDPPDEVPGGSEYAELSNRAAPGTAGTGMAYVLLEGQTRRNSDGVSIDFASGDITGGLLSGTNVDEAEYTNPANGEFSRIVRISGDNVFGAVGLDVLSGDLPTAGTVTSYNEGWVGMTAAFENDVLVLEGDATFTASWGANDIDGRFFNLSGTSSAGGGVTNVGTIILTDGTITGDNFTGGAVSGTGRFAAIGGAGTTSQTGGTFFGPDADELGGVVLINDTTDDILVVGAFQAD